MGHIPREMLNTQKESSSGHSEQQSCDHRRYPVTAVPDLRHETIHVYAVSEIGK